MIEQIAAVVGAVLAVIALAGAVIGWFRWGWPRARARWERERSIDVVLRGREAVPANPITGEPALPAIPSIGQQVHNLNERFSELIQLVEDIHHETHHNDGSSIKDAVARVELRLAAGDKRFGEVAEALDEIRGQISGELAKTTDTLADAAEASKTGLRVIESAILADPPADLR